MAGTRPPCYVAAHPRAERPGARWASNRGAEWYGTPGRARPEQSGPASAASSCRRSRTVELQASRIPDVVSLAQGIPSFDTPEPIKRFAAERMAEGACARYSVSPGLPALREAIAEALAGDGMAVRSRSRDPRHRRLDRGHRRDPAGARRRGRRGAGGVADLRVVPPGHPSRRRRAALGAAQRGRALRPRSRRHRGRGLAAARAPSCCATPTTPPAPSSRAPQTLRMLARRRRARPAGDHRRGLQGLRLQRGTAFSARRPWSRARASASSASARSRKPTA